MWRRPTSPTRGHEARTCSPASTGRAARRPTRWPPSSTCTAGRGPGGITRPGRLHCRALAASGLVVVSLGLPPGSRASVPRGQRRRGGGVRWTRAHAGRLDVDPRRIALLGSSSGGQVALAVGLRPGSARAFRHPAGPARRRGPASPTGRTRWRASSPCIPWPIRWRATATPSARARAAPTLGIRRQAPDRLASRVLRGRGGDGRGERHAHRGRGPRGGDAPGVARAAPADDNVPAEITEAFLDAYRRAGGRIERACFPGARHGFIQQAGPDADKCITLMRDCHRPASLRAPTTGF